MTPGVWRGHVTVVVRSCAEEAPCVQNSADYLGGGLELYKSAADLEGLRFRATGVAAEVFRRTSAVSWSAAILPTSSAADYCWKGANPYKILKP